MSSRLRLLFLCTGNSCRSQMAAADRIDVASAGLEARGLDPRAVAVMAEAGVDISDQRSTGIDELPDLEFDAVVTVCGHADESCPRLPAGTRKLHIAFDDPPRLAEGETAEAEALRHYRRVRDEIRRFVESLPDSLSTRGR